MIWNQLSHLLKQNHRACYLKALTLLYGIKVERIAEIGVFKGKNAQRLRTLFPKAHLYLIDPWSPDPYYLEKGGAIAKEKRLYTQAFLEVKKRFGQDSYATIIQKPSTQAVSYIQDPLDLIFIDANHDYISVKRDILTYLNLLRKGGILSGHNYGQSHLPGVKKAVDELLGEKILIGQDHVWAGIF